MAYQLVKKPREIPAGSYEKMDVQAPNTQAAGGAYGLEQPGLGDALDAQMQARMSRFMSRQNPAAEAEADAVAEGITGRTPAEVKAQLGEKMGADFSDVRFHTGADAVGKAESMGARAYATGRDVYFGEGGFDPMVAAHELVHTAQQGAVESGMSTVSAPMGGVQMMPKFLQRAGSIAKDVALASSRAMMTTGNLAWRGLKAAGRGIAKGASWLGGKVSGLFKRGDGQATAAPAAPQPAAQPARPFGSTMVPLKGAYDANLMQTSLGALLPQAQQMIASDSQGKDVSDGNRFVFLRNSSPGDARANYFEMLRRAGRGANIQFLQTLSQNIGGLPDMSDANSYKDLRGKDPARLAAIQDRSVQMTQQYLNFLESDPDAMDALRQSSSNLYESLGTYSPTNQAGLAAGKLEASHRAMNDMILRSLGPDSGAARNELGLGEEDSKKYMTVVQGMGSMQPDVLAALLDPQKAANQSPQERQMAAIFQAFFQRNGML